MVNILQHFVECLGARTIKGCLLWTGRTNDKGYGVLGDTVLAHRIAWSLVHGPIPEGLCVLHTCDNPTCVSVEHLFLGTHVDNMADRDAKGRNAHGDRNGNAKLTNENVPVLRSRYAAGGVSYQDLANEHGVSAHTMMCAIRGITWKHIV